MRRLNTAKRAQVVCVDRDNQSQGGVGIVMAAPVLVPAALLPLDSLKSNLEWFRSNLCSAHIRDPRGCRVRFLGTDFIHLNKLVDKYGKEPRNARLALEEIERGRITFKPGRFNPKRAVELAWAVDIATQPWRIVPNWQALGRGYPGEAYIANFGTAEKPAFRVLICEVIGELRRPVTIFPRERFSKLELATVLWP